MRLKKSRREVHKGLTKIDFIPGSVSRQKGSAHRWDELYADGVQLKTTEFLIDHSGI